MLTPVSASRTGRSLDPTTTITSSTGAPISDSALQRTTGDDDTSGIDTCSAGTYSTPDDTAVTVSGFCTDNAGNNSDPVASLAFDYDNTA